MPKKSEIIPDIRHLLEELVKIAGDCDQLDRMGFLPSLDPLT